MKGVSMAKIALLTIPLTQGKVALIDRKDYPLIKSYKWCAAHKGNNWYAMTNLPRKNGVQKTLYMHHLILPLKPGLMVDHANRNGLINCRDNLRYCLRRQNISNSRKRCEASSKFKGVSWHKRVGKWHAYLRHKGKLIFIGCFEDEVKAAKAYDLVAARIKGQFATLNFKEVLSNG
jgi:hypothetical protein